MRWAALIPARGGSKRVPRKNLREVGGKSLVRRAIEASRVEHVWVVSDSDEIGFVAETLGARWMREPDMLAGDNVLLERVIEYAVGRVRGFDAWVVLQPTSPLRESRHVRMAMESVEAGADSVLAVVHCPHAAFAGRLNGDSFRHYPPVESRQRTQDVNLYADCGAIYAFRTDWFRANRLRFGGDVRAVVLDRWSAIDVDTEEDLMLAEWALMRVGT